MDNENPYAPPRTHVTDVAEPGVALAEADRGTRFAAALLDAIIFGAMVYVPLLVAAVMAGGFGAVGGIESGVLVGGVLLTALLGFLVWCGLTIRFVLRNSQSIAKKLLGLKVVRTDGSPASFSRIFWLRNVVNNFLGIVPLYLIVDALFIFGESRQCLHDKLADTVVVKA
jgi:uncharacterized RDD family membrane protein YckC